MSSDDREFLDVLISLQNEILRYGREAAETVDKSCDNVAQSLRETIATAPWASWVPERFRPLPPVPPPVTAVPTSALERCQDWVSRHKILTGFIVLATGTVIYKTYKSNAYYRKKRRAKRAPNGARTEVVVIAGSPALPLTRSLALDLERKGFIVFVVSNSSEDDAMIQNLARPDIRPLGIDITDPPSAGASVEHFAQYLQTPHAAIPHGKRNRFSFKAVILIPSLNYQTSPIATIPPSSFADLFNTHLLHPILTIQAFLPLLTARLGPAPPPSAPQEKKNSTPKVLVFTPSIISSINPPFHAPEATVCSALAAFTEVLTAELRPLAIPVTHVQLGTFDFAGFTPATSTRYRNQGGFYLGGLLPAPTSDDSPEALPWPDAARHAYGRNYVNQTTSAISAGRIRGLRGTALRELHNAVFDVLDGSVTAGAVRVGLGASVYGFVGRWAPRGLVAWMMGIRKVDELVAWQSTNPSNASSQGSPARSSTGSEDAAGTEASFVDVPTAHLADHVGGDSNVWKEK